MNLKHRFHQAVLVAAFLFAASLPACGLVRAAGGAVTDVANWIVGGSSESQPSDKATPGQTISAIANFLPPPFSQLVGLLVTGAGIIVAAKKENKGNA